MGGGILIRENNFSMIAPCQETTSSSIATVMVNEGASYIEINPRGRDLNYFPIGFFYPEDNLPNDASFLQDNYSYEKGLYSMFDKEQPKRLIGKYTIGLWETIFANNTYLNISMGMSVTTYRQF